jgi:Rieske Fe-S protein
MSEHEHDCGECPLLAKPLDVACDDHRDEGITRRDFMSAAMLSAVAATLAACGGGELSAADKLLAPSGTPTTTPAPTPSGNGTPTVGANQFGVTVASYPALATAGGVAVVRTSPPIALARTASGFAAFSLRCTHEGTTVRVQSGNTLRCPNHGALFSSTGAWTGGYRTSSLSARGVQVSNDKSFVVVNLT